MTGRGHISNSQLEMYAKCGEAYRRRYMDNEKIAPGIAALVGTGTHGGAEFNFTQKIETHEDRPVSEIVEAAVATFEDRMSIDGYELTPDEKSTGARKTLAKAKDKTAQLAEQHALVQAPEYQPVEVEERSTILLPGATRDLVAITDLVDDQDRVIDLKTAGKKKNQTEADVSTQLTIYAAAFHARHGRPCSEVRLDTLTTTASVKRQVLSSTRDASDYLVLANRVQATLNAIEAGVFTPASPMAWNCSAKWCGYWKTCPYASKRTT